MSKARVAAISKAVAAGHATSASSYIERALEAIATLDSYDELLAEWRREIGPATAEEKAWARDVTRQATASAARKPT
ncbi:MAG: hypothetical protein IT379_36615 [Deltaproteobacteria bacterium]|nr:hypothetical protein [Deltaproteobacteria bacterium]